MGRKPTDCGLARAANAGRDVRQTAAGWPRFPPPGETSGRIGPPCRTSVPHSRAAAPESEPTVPESHPPCRAAVAGPSNRVLPASVEFLGRRRVEGGLKRVKHAVAVAFGGFEPVAEGEELIL